MWAGWACLFTDRNHIFKGTSNVHIGNTHTHFLLCAMTTECETPQRIFTGVIRYLQLMVCEVSFGLLDVQM